MQPHDRKHMDLAISLAETCQPENENIPKVGAVIANGETVIALGYRGKDDHAEKMALEKVPADTNLADVSIYTTLEPCTKEVRREIENSCSERLINSGIRRVFVGILDPNPGVTGRGVLRLQKKGIEVQFFPVELAARISMHNQAFIIAQSNLGIEITKPEPGIIHELTTAELELEGKLINLPTDLGVQGVYSFVKIGSKIWPQTKLSIDSEKKWKTKVYFGQRLERKSHEICIVKADSLGEILINHYNLANDELHERQRRLGEEKTYLGIEANGFPKGLDVQATIQVIVSSQAPSDLAETDPAEDSAVITESPEGTEINESEK